MNVSRCSLPVRQGWPKIAPRNTQLDTMGFEQLAALKAQLAAQAKAEKAAKAAEVPKRATPPRARDAVLANPAKPVDPVVHTIARLQRRFPLAFPKYPAPKLPLKIGIFEDLLPHAQKLALTEAELREAIKTWCRGARYWACLIEGTSRRDLAGQGGAGSPGGCKTGAATASEAFAVGTIQIGEGIAPR